MYARCHLCNRSLGVNEAVAHMPVGQRLAWDVTRGRLWVVCPGCSEWNLTPVEERWEAIEDCERLFAGAEARASTKHVGLSRARGVDLIRIGPALRDEIANWRYGPRFTRRHRRTKLLIGGVGTLSVAAVGATALAGVMVSGVVVGLYAAAFVGSWFVVTMEPLSEKVGPGPLLRVEDARGREIWLTKPEMERLEFQRNLKTGATTAIRLHLWREQHPLRLGGQEALVALGRILPRMNWRGGQERVIERATAMVDAAEERMRRRGAPDVSAQSVWEHIVLSDWPSNDRVLAMPLISRLALEMAVSEELERQAMAGEAEVLGAQWPEAEHVASIADDMFIPDRIADWVRQQRRGRNPKGGQAMPADPSHEE